MERAKPGAEIGMELQDPVLPMRCRSSIWHAENHHDGCVLVVSIYGYFASMMLVSTARRGKGYMLLTANKLPLSIAKCI